MSYAEHTENNRELLPREAEYAKGGFKDGKRTHTCTHTLSLTHAHIHTHTNALSLTHALIHTLKLSLSHARTYANVTVLAGFCR